MYAVRTPINVHFCHDFSRNTPSVTTFLLTGRWNHCTQNSQMDHALHQYKDINKINFGYKLYKLCGLL